MSTDRRNDERGNEKRNEKRNEIALKKSLTIAIPSNIPENEIKLKRLEDGYSISVSHEYRNKTENGESRSSFSYQAEEHYGRKVNKVSGHFDERGGYKIDVDFQED